MEHPLVALMGPLYDHHHILQRWQVAVPFNSMTPRPHGKTIGSQHAFRVPKVGIPDILRTDMRWLRRQAT